MSGRHVLVPRGQEHWPHHVESCCRTWALHFAWLDRVLSNDRAHAGLIRLNAHLSAGPIVKFLKGDLADDLVAEIAPGPHRRGCHDQGQGQWEAGKATEQLRVAHGTILPMLVRSSHGSEDSSPKRRRQSIGECPYTWSEERGWAIRLSSFECLPPLARLPPSLQGGPLHGPDLSAPLVA